MIADPKVFYMGAGLFAVFVVVLVLMFLPLFDGRNALNYMDALYNSISKGSAYYIPELKKKASGFDGRDVTVKLLLDGKEEARETARLFAKAGVGAEVAGAQVKVTGDLGKILAACLEDSNDMFENSGDRVEARYGCSGEKALYGWWKALKAMDRALKSQELFSEARVTSTVVQKGVECAYNYYGIEPRKISDKFWIVFFSLVFYVVYTVWYGFALMFMFEGLGFRLSH